MGSGAGDGRHRVLEVESVTKRYGAFVALQDVSFTAGQGLVHGLVGYNGAGKTTLLKTIAGVYRCDGGAVLLEGESVHRRRRPGRAPFLVADEPYLPPRATPDLLRRFYRGYYPSWRDDVYDRLLEAFELDAKGRVERFSKGMRRQVVLLLALASGSRCLLLDESFDGLDLGKRNLFKLLLRRYARQRDAVVVLSSHNLRELEGVVDRVALLEGRHLIFDETVAELHGRFRHYRLSGEISAAERDRLEESRALRWLRRDDDGALAFVADVAVEVELAQHDASIAGRLASSPATLEEIFLNRREVSDDDLERIFA